MSQSYRLPCFMKISSILNNTVLVFSLIYAVNSVAIDVADNAEIHGFASLGYVNSGGNPFYGDTLNGSIDFQELAINGFWEPNDTIRLSGQVLYRNTGSVSQKHVNVDFLMADFKAIDQESHTAGIRLGRVKVPYGLYNSSRDVPHGRPGVFVPKSVYFDSFRDTILAVDGVNLYGNLFGALGNLDYQFYAGRRGINNNSMEHFLFSGDVEGEFDRADIMGLQVMFQPATVDGLKVGYSLFKVDMALNDGSTVSATELGSNYALEYLFANAVNPFSPSLDELRAAQDYAQQQITQTLTNNYRPYINDAELNSYMHLLSVQYFWKNLTFTGEYLRAKSETTLDIAAMLNQTDKVTSEGYYLQVEWQAMEQLLLLARYEKLYLDTSDKNGSKGVESGRLLTPYTHYGKGFTIGARWYFTSNLSLTGEYSHNKGAAWLPKDDSIDAKDLKEDWEYFALQLSYHF